jgi:hypothetical protein
LKDLNQLKLNYFFSLQKDGILDEETIVQNLSNLGAVADGSRYSYLTLSLQGCGLKNIKALTKFKELQTLELSFNQLKGFIS